MTSTSEIERPLFAGIVDDDTGLIEQVDKLDDALPIRLRGTTDFQESLDWVRQHQVSWLICDLRMGRVDGIDVLEKAYRIDNSITFALLTSHELTPAQKRRLKQIGAIRYTKDTGLLQLLRDVAESEATASSIVALPTLPAAAGAPRPIAELGVDSLANMQARLDQYRDLYQELVDDFVTQLTAIRDLNSKVTAGNESFSVAELIDDVRNLRPRGVEHMRLWLRAFRTLREVRGRRK